MKNTKLRVVIPAAGRGVRSGLNYPKCLYKINGEPILISLLKRLIVYDEAPIIIINPRDRDLFEKEIDIRGYNPKYVYQNRPYGMGDAVLCANDLLEEDETILLVWSDLPFLNENTIRALVNCHFYTLNDFSFVSSIGENCYTIVKRDKGNVVSLIETRALNIPPLPYGERDIGIFIFRKDPVFKLLREGRGGDYENGVREHGFLDVIEKLSLEGFKIEAYPIALPIEVFSFNSQEDLIVIEAIKKID